jgi:hypothetical protein
MKYKGYTHLPVPHFLYGLWHKFLCKRGIHLWDEVLSGGDPWKHYFVCDACQKTVDIKDE